MDFLGRIFGGLFGAFLTCTQSLPQGVSLFILSTILGVAMLLSFRWFGDREALRTAILRMQAYIMEMRLVDREPRLVFVAIIRLMWWNLRLMVAMFRPALFATVPMLLLMVQMEHYYGIRPLRPGESTVVTAMFRDAEAIEGELRLDVRGGARVETPAVRSPYRKIASWRVGSDHAGDFNLQL